MKGLNIQEVQRLLGHKGLETTTLYLPFIRNLQSLPMSSWHSPGGIIKPLNYISESPSLA